MKSRMYESLETAKADLSTKGKLEYFGRAGVNYEYCVFTLTLLDGRKYGINIYDNGLVEIANEF